MQETKSRYLYHTLHLFLWHQNFIPGLLNFEFICAISVKPVNLRSIDFVYKMGIMWEELAPRFKDLLEQGKSGVVASLIAVSQRLQSHENKVSMFSKFRWKFISFLVSKLCSYTADFYWFDSVVRPLLVQYAPQMNPVSPFFHGCCFLITTLVVEISLHGSGHLVQRCMSWVVWYFRGFLSFLVYVSFSSCVDKNSFSAFNFQIFGFSCAFTVTPNFFSISQDHIQPYITSLTSMKAEYITETAKDSSGARVIEAFLASDAATKQKRRLIIKYALLLDFIWGYVYLKTDRFHSSLFIWFPSFCFFFIQSLRLLVSFFFQAILHILMMFLFTNDFVTDYVDILASSHYTRLVHLQLRSASMHVIWH